MCGIFGYIGKASDAPSKVFEGLRDIEYRGYDSWGVASWNMESGIWNLEKKIGFLPESFNAPKSSVAIGHTRWATHGGATEANAHPHLSCDGKIVLVHNGIVENYLRSEEHTSELQSQFH